MHIALKFVLALLPLIAVFIGILRFKRSGAEMAVAGLALCGALAVAVFKTPPIVVGGAIIYGILKGLGITIAVVFTMFMIFLMKEVGALAIISDAIKRVASTKEEQALFIGIAFGTFVTSLGVVTPALFPPLLVAMGFSAGAAVAIAVLGYNASTSFALLSIPVTLPAAAFVIDVYDFTYKITLFLPVVSTIISVAMLWVVGGRDSVRRGIVPALLLGLVIGLSAILLVVIRFPIMLLGVAVGLIGMGIMYAYISIFKSKEETSKEWQPLDRNALLRALSPWLILIVIAALVSIPAITEALKPLDGDGFSSVATAHQTIDFDFFVQPYFPILLALIFSYPLLRPKREEMSTVFRVWRKRIWGPVIAYSLFFSLAYIMAYSALEIVNGRLITAKELYDPSFIIPNKDALVTQYEGYNMNIIAGKVLSDVFGNGYIFVAAALGLFGAVVGGSETGSNMLFYGIQKNASDNINLTNNEFLTVYAAHANAGGVASAITPSKINNAVATIGADKEVESDTMKNLLPIVVLLTILIGIMTGIFVKLAI